jgi:hypothetical protein
VVSRNTDSLVTLKIADCAPSIYEIEGFQAIQADTVDRAVSLRRRSAAARFLGSRVGVAAEARMLVCCDFCVLCQ